MDTKCPLLPLPLEQNTCQITWFFKITLRFKTVCVEEKIIRGCAIGRAVLATADTWKAVDQLDLGLTSDL